MTGNTRAQRPERCSEPCETVICRLLQGVEQSPRDWRLRYQLGICCSGRCQAHPLVSPDLALGYLDTARKASCEPEDSVRSAAMLSLLGLMYQRSTVLPRRAQLLCAVECQEKAAAICLKRGAYDEWARMQYNLGNMWCEFPDRLFPAKWENAIAYYECALCFRTQASDSASSAATLENLGTAYRQLPTGDKAANVHRAIRCYRRALRLCPVTTAPTQWAALHNNLGNACLSLPFTGVDARASHARHAIRHFDLALKVRTPERNLFDHAVTRLNRGQACLHLAHAGATSWLFEAAQCFRDAHTGFLRTGAATEAIAARNAIASITQLLKGASELQSEDNSRSAS